MSRPITVGVATYRRESLETTLASLDALDGVRPTRIIVSDNDETPSAKALVDHLTPTLRTPITYRHAPAGNIAIARNALLEEAGSGLLAIMDDDETAPPDWLASLQAKMTPGIEAAFGPVTAQYPDNAPRWMRTLSPHSQSPAMTGGEVLVGYTSNCLIDLDTAPFRDLRFDPALGGRQSEDTAFFLEARKRGARFALAPEAVLSEPVPPARMSADWLRARRRRHGASWAELFGQKGPGSALEAAAKAGLCYGLGTLLYPAPARRWGWYLRGDFHAGRCRGALSAT